MTQEERLKKIEGLIDALLLAYDSRMTAWRYINSVEDEPEDRVELQRRDAALLKARAELLRFVSLPDWTS